uniref:DUF1989 domain-containing protein n=1 Tax=Strongyloides venezuelensis TaxID=75913 RepID=A0A0K0G5G5_STRVS
MQASFQKKVMYIEAGVGVIISIDSTQLVCSVGWEDQKIFIIQGKHEKTEFCLDNNDELRKAVDVNPYRTVRKLAKS